MLSASSFLLGFLVHALDLVIFMYDSKHVRSVLSMDTKGLGMTNYIVMGRNAHLIDHSRAFCIN